MFGYGARMRALRQPWCFDCVVLAWCGGCCVARTETDV
jgi:radical SAM protein with 4Fe4S-binding SPASM domain